MSLFENDHYRWRETYFVLYEVRHRPTADAVRKTLRELGDRYEITEVKANDDGLFESLSLISPYDFAAMDITYIAGEEVTDHVATLLQELKSFTLTKEEMIKIDRLPKCNARFDVYHFEQVAEESDEDEMLDPGALLIVLERLAKLVHGVSIDPQSGSVM